MIFAQELQDAVLDEVQIDEDMISFQSWKDAADGDSPSSVIRPGEALHVFLASTAGVGEAPDNGRDFFAWINDEAQSCMQKLIETLFGFVMDLPDLSGDGA